MSIRLYRLWHSCEHLERISTTRLAWNLMYSGILIWVITCIVPLFTILFFPDQLGQWKTLFITLTGIIGGLLMTVVFGSMILAGLYASSYLRTKEYVENAFLTCIDEKEFASSNAVLNSLQYRKRRLEAEADAVPWLPVPLPVKRKWALIQAGIPVEEALKDTVREMTLEDLHIMTVLHGRTPTQPSREIVYVGAG